MWIRKLPILPTIITLLCVVIMFGLGIWQLERKVQKDTRLAQISERQSNRPYKLSELLTEHTASNNSDVDIQDFPVSFAGTAQMDTLFFIDNRIVSGRIGYELVVPIITMGGDIVLVNFGWLRGSGIRGQLPELSAEVRALFSNQSRDFTGVVSYPSLNRMVSETNIAFGQFPALLQQIDVAQIHPHLSAMGFLQSGKLFPFVVNLAPEPNSEFVRNWQPVVMSPEKHLGYAVQWFGLGIAALTIYLLSLMKLFKTKNNKENKEN
ncbi:MAG: surfeit locus 1 family protein [Glaciecola sp.]|jgi:surfeit locus 1 family protein